MVAVDKADGTRQLLPEAAESACQLPVCRKQSVKAKLRRILRSEALRGGVEACEIGEDSDIANLDDQVKPPALFPLPSIQHSQGTEYPAVQVTQQPDQHGGMPRLGSRERMCFPVMPAGHRR